MAIRALKKRTLSEFSKPREFGVKKSTIVFIVLVEILFVSVFLNPFFLENGFFISWIVWLFWLVGEINIYTHVFLHSIDFSTKLQTFGETFNVRFDNTKTLKNQTDNFKMRDQKGVLWVFSKARKTDAECGVHKEKRYWETTNRIFQALSHSSFKILSIQDLWENSNIPKMCRQCSVRETWFRKHVTNSLQ